MELTIILYCLILLSILIISSTAVDNIRANQTIRDGCTIVSAGGEFELGFFSPGSSTKRYLGIWYNKKSHGTVVWVANREAPLNSSSGAITVNNRGIIVQDIGGDSGDNIVWSSGLTTRHVTNPIMQLLDTGNLVIREENKQNLLWQSFDYPSNNMLPGMKLGVNFLTGFERYYTSWKSIDDPSPGRYMFRMDPNGFPQIFGYKDSLVLSRIGPWIGSQFSGDPHRGPNDIYAAGTYFFNRMEVYYSVDLVTNKSTAAIARIVLNLDGKRELLVWNDQNQDWIVYNTFTLDDCEKYGFCGKNSICNINNTPRCECMWGFVPQFREKWKSADWSNGCVREQKLNCNTKGLGFVKYSGVKLPDTRQSWYDMGINLEECKKLCLKNCSCTAYTNADTRKGGSGCLLWFHHLVDMTGYTKDRQDIYVKMAASELGESRGIALYQQVWFPLIFLVLTVVLVLTSLHIFKKRKLHREERLKFNSEVVALNKIESEDLKMPLFRFREVAKATNDFSHNNKLGEGGFGPVYKGMLADGQEIAVKRLSKNSSQGLDEFRNEVSLIAKLQHRNLVALLGCCIEGGERILIYEYMPNKSLDSFIFDEEASKSLGWSRRYNIIIGIARGLLYLHQDSKLRIIHRDLKASNILLDYDMNPKISDFGMARCFGGSQTEANTTRVVGTYGYMSPEYVIDGRFSIKSDIYSFGVLLIEMVTGTKNRLFSHPDHSLNLLGHAWTSFKEDKILELIDGVILELSNNIEVFRVIHIGLLCVQQYPEDRPSMSQVIQMLTSKIQLPHPKQPGFFEERKQHKPDDSQRTTILNASNQLTITTVAPRD